MKDSPEDQKQNSSGGGGQLQPAQPSKSSRSKSLFIVAAVVIAIVSCSIGGFVGTALTGLYRAKVAAQPTVTPTQPYLLTRIPTPVPSHTPNLQSTPALPTQTPTPTETLISMPTDTVEPTETPVPEETESPAEETPTQEPATPEPTETPVPADPTNTPVPAEPREEPAPTDAPAPAEVAYKIAHHKVLGEGENNGGIFDAGGQHLIFVTVLDAAGNGVDGAVIKDDNGSALEIVTGDKGPGKAEITMEWDPYKLYVAADPAGPTTSEVSNQMNTAYPHIPDVIGKLGSLENEYSVCPTADVRCVPPFYNVHFSYEITFQKVN